MNLSQVYGDINAAADGDGLAMRRVLRKLVENQQAEQAQAGLSPSDPPPVGSIAVAGVDGHFLITLTPASSQPVRTQQQASQSDAADLNPAIDLQPLLHQVQSATSVLFDNTAGVTTYGPDSKTNYDITDPNVTKVWRYRSSADGGVTWNAWTYLSSAAVCGVAPVYSGVLRSSSNDIVNSAAQTTDGTNPLSNGGTNTVITVATKSYNIGNQVLSYAGGTVDPGSYGKSFVYIDDPQRKGTTAGNSVFHTTANIGDLAVAGRVFIGFITTVNGTGSSGSGGGNGGGCKVFGTLITMVDGSTRVIESLRKGSVIRSAKDGGPETLQADPILSIQPCLAFATATRRMKGCSTTDLLGFDGGGYEKAENFFVSDRVAGGEALTERSWLGFLPVLALWLDRTKTFIADDFDSHNNKSL